jgi:hypothetical protein
MVRIVGSFVGSHSSGLRALKCRLTTKTKHLINCLTHTAGRRREWIRLILKAECHSTCTSLRVSYFLLLFSKNISNSCGRHSDSTYKVRREGEEDAFGMCSQLISAVKAFLSPGRQVKCYNSANEFDVQVFMSDDCLTLRMLQDPARSSLSSG